jgi:hypothetical protein
MAFVGVCPRLYDPKYPSSPSDLSIVLCRNRVMNRRYRKPFRLYESASPPSRHLPSVLDLLVHLICVMGFCLLIAEAQNLARG